MRWLVEIGRAAGTAAQPWTIDASGLGSPYRFTLHVAPDLVPEPGAAGLALVAFAALAAITRRRTRSAACVCLALALANATDARAGTVTISSSADGGAGSLRFALANTVQPGDTIVFAVSEVQIGAQLLVIAIPNVTLQGPVTLRPSGSIAAVDVRANGVSLLDVTLRDVQLSVGSVVTLAGFTLAGSTLTGNAPVFVENIVGCAITNNRFNAVDPAGRSNVVLALQLTESCNVIDNTITSPLRWHIEDDNSTALTLHDNDVGGNIWATPRSGSITLNDARELAVFPPDGAHDALLVQANPVGRLRVVRTNVEILDNVVNPALHAADLGLAGVAAALSNAAKAGSQARGSFAAQGNTVSGGRTCVLFTDWAGPAIPSDLVDNTLTGCTQRGLLALGPDGTAMIGNTITGNGGVGAFVGGENAYGRIAGGVLHGNDGAGAFIDTGARIEITAASFQGNTGPGIDLAPGAVTPNPATKTANEDLDWPEDLRFDPIGQKLMGLARPGARVEVYVVEGGARLGNPDNGEGVTPLGTTLADSLGNWAFPDIGTLGGFVTCDEQTNLTTTATVLGPIPYTSEFSPDYDCSDPPLGVDLGGGAYASCENPATCAIGPTGGTCFECTLSDGTVRYECDAGEPCTYSNATGYFSCGAGCDANAGAVEIACTEGCQRPAEGELRCDGGAGGCTSTANGATIAQCPVDVPCVVRFGPGGEIFGAAEIGQVGRITVSKQTTGGDGLFDFIFPGFLEPVREQIQTSGGFGTKQVQYVHPASTFPGFGGIRAAEVVPTDWELTSIDCDPPLARTGDGVLADLPPGGTIECVFHNTFTGSGTLVDPGVDGPDALAHTNTFGLPPGDRVVVGGTNGLAVVEPLTGTVPTVGNASLAFLGLPSFSNLIGALVIQHPTIAAQDAFFGYGTNTGFARVYVPANQDFGSTLLLGSGFSDAVHLGNDPSQEAIAVRSSGGGTIARFEFVDFGGGQYFPGRQQLRPRRHSAASGPRSARMPTRVPHASSSRSPGRRASW